MRVIPFEEKYRQDFINFNTDWIISNLGFLEEHDKETFEKMDEEMKAGAMIFFAVENDVALATCMAMPMEGETWEICKLRIDVLAVAIHAGLKATQLKDLDLAYALPYSSAKAPVNIAGFMVDNIAKGILKQWHLEDIGKLPKDGSATLLDVQTTAEYNRGQVQILP